MFVAAKKRTVMKMTVEKTPRILSEELVVDAPATKSKKKKQ